MQLSPSTVHPEKFVLFPVGSLADNSVTDFDLFVKVSNHVVLYGGIGYRWERTELQGLVNSGLENFYIKPEDQPKADIYRKISLLPELEKNLAPKDRINAIQEIGTEFVKILFEVEITESCVEKARTIAAALVDCILEDKSCIQSLSGLGEHDIYTYRHSIRVSAYIASIAVQMGLTDHAKLRDMALGGIFHDVGKKQVPLTILHKRGALTNDEWKQMRSHPGMGYVAVSKSILSYVPKEIILHHHERMDGSGYPDGLDRGSILTEVQIAAVADIFDALTSSRSYQNKRSRFEALDFIRHRLLGHQLGVEPFQALIACLVIDPKNQSGQ